MLESYTILGQIAETNNSVVYKAKRKTENEMVVIKRSRSTPDSIQRFANEIQVLEKLRGQKFIVKLLDWSIEDEYYYLVFPHYESDLGSYIYVEKQNQLNVFRIWRLCVQISRALQAVHAIGFFHGDIKPGNIFVNGRDFALSDFSHSEMFPRKLEVDDDTYKSRRTDVAYLAPEMNDGRLVTVASELYSVATILKELLFGMMSEDEKKRKCYALTYKVIYRALDETPEKRYQTIKSFLRHFRFAFLIDFSIGMARIFKPQMIWILFSLIIGIVFLILCKLKIQEYTISQLLRIYGTGVY